MIGSSDDSLTLTAYFAEKRIQQITLEEIFSDLGVEMRIQQATDAQDSFISWKFAVRMCPLIDSGGF